jgi:EpsI family protein
MKKNKALLALTLILLTAGASFLLPKTKYTSPDILGQLRIPEKFSYWASKDISDEFNPKVCYGSSGFKAIDLQAPAIKLKDRTIKTNAVFFDKPGESYVIIYWITINKQTVNWTGQKLLQLWYSLFNKQKTGLMVRLDIPATAQTTDSALKLAQEFISQIAPQIPPDQQDYLFGK